MIYSGIGTKLSAGAFGVRLLYSNYSGPCIQIKAGSGGIATDFYADVSGNLTTISGTSLTSFLGGQIAYVTMWYDQTGNTNHGTVNNTNVTYNTVNKTVTFSGGYLSLPNGAYPYANSPYTYVYTPTNLSGAYPQPIHWGGTNSEFQACITYLTSSTQIQNSWWTDNSYPGGTTIDGTKITEVYDGNPANVNWYLNGALVGKNTSSKNSNRAQTMYNNYLAYDGNVSGWNSRFLGSFQFFYWAPTAMSVIDFTILNNT